jgi:hypothetical protein
MARRLVLPLVLAAAASGCEHHHSTAPATLTGVPGLTVRAATAGGKSDEQVYVGLLTTPPGDSCLDHMGGANTGVGKDLGGTIFLNVDPKTISGKTFDLAPIASTSGVALAELDLWPPDPAGLPLTSIHGMVTFSADTTMYEYKGSFDADVTVAGTTDPGADVTHVSGTFDAPSCAPLTSL